MNFEDLIKHEQVDEALLSARTIRHIAKYREIEATPETAQEIEDLNEIIVNDIVLYIAEKRAKDEAAAEAAKKGAKLSEEEIAALEKEKKFQNRGLFQRITDRYKPSR